jgi:hypothetical protein
MSRAALDLARTSLLVRHPILQDPRQSQASASNGSLVQHAASQLYAAIATARCCKLDLAASLHSSPTLAALLDAIVTAHSPGLIKSPPRLIRAIPSQACGHQIILPWHFTASSES